MRDRSYEGSETQTRNSDEDPCAPESLMYSEAGNTHGSAATELSPRHDRLTLDLRRNRSCQPTLPKQIGGFFMANERLVDISRRQFLAAGGLTVASACFAPRF